MQVQQALRVKAQQLMLISHLCSVRAPPACNLGVL